MAALFAALAGMLFGALAVAVRDGLRRGADPEAGAVVVATVGFLLVTVVAAPQIAAGFDVADLWPFLLAGAIVPGATQILFILAIRHVGPSRASVLIGTAPLMSVLIAIALLDEPVKVELLIGTLLVVSGGAALARERVRPEHFRLIGAALALVCAALFAVRDNIVRWAARDTHPPPLVACATALLASALVNLVYVSLRRKDVGPAVRPFAIAGVLLAASYACLLEAFDRGRVSVVAPLNATQSLWAVVFAAFFVGRSEAIGPRLVVAGALIVAGGALIGAAR